MTQLIILRDDLQLNTSHTVSDLYEKVQEFKEEGCELFG